MMDALKTRLAVASAVSVVLLLCWVALVVSAGEPQGETRTNSFVSMRDYVDARFAAMEKAVSLSYETMQARLEILNESRGQLRDQAANFVTKGEMEQVHQQIASLNESRAELRGKASANSVLFTGGIAVLSLALSVVGFMRNRKPQC